MAGPVERISIGQIDMAKKDRNGRSEGMPFPSSGTTHDL